MDENIPNDKDETDQEYQDRISAEVDEANPYRIMRSLVDGIEIGTDTLLVLTAERAKALGMDRVESLRLMEDCFADHDAVVKEVTGILHASVTQLLKLVGDERNAYDEAIGDDSPSMYVIKHLLRLSNACKQIKKEYETFSKLHGDENEVVRGFEQ